MLQHYMVTSVLPNENSSPNIMSLSVFPNRRLFRFASILVSANIPDRCLFRLAKVSWHHRYYQIAVYFSFASISRHLSHIIEYIISWPISDWSIMLIHQLNPLQVSGFVKTKSYQCPCRLYVFPARTGGIKIRWIPELAQSKIWLRPWRQFAGLAKTYRHKKDSIKGKED